MKNVNYNPQILKKLTLRRGEQLSEDEQLERLGSVQRLNRQRRGMPLNAPDQADLLRLFGR
jgi:hypothetical protein